MIRERDKSRKILNALIDSFVVMEFTELVTSIAIKEDVTEIVVEGIVNADHLKIEEIKRLLNHPRIREYENTYDNLLESSTENELDAIGYLIDESEVIENGNALSMKLIRYH